MNKKLKKILATISAIAMCAVSATTISASAEVTFYLGDRVNEYTTSFTVNDYQYGKIKYNFWQAGTDFFGNSYDRIFISEEPLKFTNRETGEESLRYDTILYSKGYGLYPFWWADRYKVFSVSTYKEDVNEGKIELIAEYLT